MTQFVWNIVLAIGGGVLIGLCFLMQVVLRDIYDDRSKTLSSCKRWGGILMRFLAGAFALFVIVFVGRLISRMQDLMVVNVIAALLGLIVCFRAGRTVAGKLAESARGHL